jgi:hypothetical protein
MSYIIEQGDTHFAIRARDKEVAFLNTKEKLLSQNSNWRGGSRAEVAASKNLIELLKAWNWTIEEDEKGNVTDIMFEGEKNGDYDVLWFYLAPYVVSGSYIEMIGEDTERWRWRFDHGHFLVQEGQFVWNHKCLCPTCKRTINIKG